MDQYHLCKYLGNMTVKPFTKYPWWTCAIFFNVKGYPFLTYWLVMPYPQKVKLPWNSLSLSLILHVLGPMITIQWAIAHLQQLWHHCKLQQYNIEGKQTCWYSDQCPLIGPTYYKGSQSLEPISNTIPHYCNTGSYIALITYH